MGKVTYYSVWVVRVNRIPEKEAEVVAFFSQEEWASNWAQANFPNRWSLERVLINSSLLFVPVPLVDW